MHMFGSQPSKFSRPVCATIRLQPAGTLLALHSAKWWDPMSHVTDTVIELAERWSIRIVIAAIDRNLRPGRGADRDGGGGRGGLLASRVGDDQGHGVDAGGHIGVLGGGGGRRGRDGRRAI